MKQIWVLIYGLLLSHMVMAASPECYSDNFRLTVCNNENWQFNGTVTDSATGLIWMQQAGGYIPNWRYTDAQAWVQTVKHHSYQLLDKSVAGDWRLPTAAELLVLATAPDFRLYFRNWQSACYWTGLGTLNNGQSAYAVDFGVDPPEVLAVSKTGTQCFAIGVRK